MGDLEEEVVICEHQIHPWGATKPQDCGDCDKCACDNLNYKCTGRELREIKLRDLIALCEKKPEIAWKFEKLGVLEYMKKQAMEAIPALYLG